MQTFIRTVGKFPKRAAKRSFGTCAGYVMVGSLVMALAAGHAGGQTSADSIHSEQRLDSSLEAPASRIWEAGVGEGFKCGAQSLSLSAGATYGIADFGTTLHHDLALASITYGRMLGCVWTPNTCFRGNWEFRLELFGGAQFSPTTDWIVGLTPHLRYNFATGTRWVPFVDAGAGVTGTGIGEPDLNGKFQFMFREGLACNGSSKTTCQSVWRRDICTYPMRASTSQTSA